MKQNNNIWRPVSLFLLGITAASFGCAEVEEGTWSDPESGHIQIKSSANFPTPKKSCAKKERIRSRGPALVFRNVDALERPFNIRRMLKRIIKTSGGSSSVKDLARNFLNTNRATQRKGSTKIPFPVDRRDAELEITVSEFLNNMKPKAVFNRIDLAAEDGSHCGEQRVVYSLDNSAPFTLIFESKIPNPRRKKGLAGCKPIARFWANLQNTPMSSEARAKRLAKLFFGGAKVKCEDLRSFILIDSRVLGAN